MDRIEFLEVVKPSMCTIKQHNGRKTHQISIHLLRCSLSQLLTFRWPHSAVLPGQINNFSPLSHLNIFLVDCQVGPHVSSGSCEWGFCGIYVSRSCSAAGAPLDSWKMQSFMKTEKRVNIANNPEKILWVWPRSMSPPRNPERHVELRGAKSLHFFAPDRNAPLKGLHPS